MTDKFSVRLRGASTMTCAIKQAEVILEQSVTTSFHPARRVTGGDPVAFTSAYRPVSVK